MLAALSGSGHPACTPRLLENLSLDTQLQSRQSSQRRRLTPEHYESPAEDQTPHH